MPNFYAEWQTFVDSDAPDDLWALAKALRVYVIRFVWAYGWRRAEREFGIASAKFLAWMDDGTPPVFTLEILRKVGTDDIQEIERLGWSLPGRKRIKRMH